MRYDCTDHGFLKKITDFFKKRKVKYKVIDSRVFPTASKEGIKEAHYFVRQRDFQNEALNELFKCPMGLVHIGVGGGKTWIMAALAMAYPDKKFLVTVPTKGLLTKTHQFLADNLNETIGLIGDSNFDIQRVTVSTYSSLIQKKMTIERHGRKVQVMRPVPPEVIKLKKEVDILLMDECIAAGTLLKTEKGLVPIEEIPTHQCKYVLTKDKKHVKLLPITGWWDMGTKPTITLHFENGRKLTCTNDHKIKTKNRGWIEAGQLLSSDLIYCVPVDVDCPQEKHLLDDNESLFQNITMLGTEDDPKKILIGKNVSKTLQKTLHSVLAVAVDVSKAFLNQWSICENKEQKNLASTSIFKGTINAHVTTPLNLLQKKKERYLEPYLGMPLLSCPTNVQKIIGSPSITPTNRKHGQNIKLPSCKKSILNYVRQKTKASATLLSEDIVAVFPPLQNLFRSFFKVVKKSLPQNFSIAWANEAWLGGTLTMAPQVVTPVNLQLIPLVEKAWTWLKNGLKKGLVVPLFLKRGLQVSPYDLIRSPLISLKTSLETLFQSQCDTNFTKLKKIETGPSVKVYDISVKGPKCFFANGILVHNCHHAKSTTQQTFLRSIPTPAKIGFSGTIVLKGEDMVVEGLFGSVKAERSLVWLIENGYCAKPIIEMLQYPSPPEQLKEELHENPHQRWRIGYVSGIVKNKWRNCLIAKRTKELTSAGLATLIMVRRKRHGRILIKRLIKKGIRAKYVHGTILTPEIVAAREALNNGELQALVCTSIFDEGEDIPNVGALILAVGEKSPQRLEQRLGRALRAIGGKTKAIVIDFQDLSNEYVRKHSRKRFKFYEKLGFKVTIKDYVSKNGKLRKLPKISKWKRKKRLKK